MSGIRPVTLALLYPGNRAARNRSDPAESRFAALFAAFAEAGVLAEPAVWHDDFADEVAAQLRHGDAVLVWCNPIEDGHRRDRLDAILREVAREGVFVSTHPDTILRLGTKDVLVDTRELPFGSDVQRIDNLDQLATELPSRWTKVLVCSNSTAATAASGCGGCNGTNRKAAPCALHHAARGSQEETVDWPTLLARLAPYFEPAQGGHMIDQAWQRRLAEGMVRAYLVGDRVGGFGHQTVNAGSTPTDPVEHRRRRDHACTTVPTMHASRI